MHYFQAIEHGSARAGECNIELLNDHSEENAQQPVVTEILQKIASINA